MSLLPITNFDFETKTADQDLLIKAWMPEIEQAALTHVADSRTTAFVIALLRAAARSKSFKNLNMMELIQKSGYSRATFFRMFEGYTGFLLKGYQLTCMLSTRVYIKYLKEQQLSLDEFCTFTTDVFFGANCTVPNEVVQMLWQEHSVSHATSTLT